MSVEIVSRETWGAETYRSLLTLFHPVPSIFINYSGQAPCNDDEECLYTIRKMQYFNMYVDRQPDILFNFAVGGNGKVYEGRGWHRSPTLPVRYFENVRCSLLITYFGNYYDSQIPATPEMQELVEQLLIYGVKNKLIHRKFLLYNF